MRARWVYRLSVLLALLFTEPAIAQSSATALLLSPDLRIFPQISLYLDLHDSEGRFVHGLQPEQLRLLEDGQEVALTQLQELRPGAQVVWVINPGPPFGIRNKDGIARYDFLKQALNQWAQERRGSNLDDLSLLVTGGQTVSHTTSLEEWRQALEVDQTNVRNATPNLDTLARAITLAADTLPRPGMERVIFYLCPPPEQSQLEILEGLFSQAMERRIRIVTWVVASAEATSAAPVQRLQALSLASGGQFFVYTGEETIPNPESYLEAWRSIYRLEYLSQVASSGAHLITAQIQTTGIALEAPAIGFEIDLQPPEPAFVSPPIQVTRKALSPAGSPTAGAAGATTWLPEAQELQVVFDFPDGRKRPIVYSALYVNGQLVAENQAAPFDRFTWKLADYTASSSYQLKVEARDSLGLTGASVEIPVAIRIETPAERPFAIFTENALLLSSLAGLLAGSILLLILILSGKIRPRVPATRTTRRLHRDPLTQPVAIRHESAPKQRPGWVERWRWPGRQELPPSQAFLKPWEENKGHPGGTVIPLEADEIVIGSDPSQAQVVLPGPGIAPQHARLNRTQAGSYMIGDLHSVAGTWVNFAQVSPEGLTLMHGDLVHFGQNGYIFSLRQPAQTRKITQVLVEYPTRLPQ